ncbi:DUF6188 family protein [Roseisolibacter sp. H3M3-2]|uniref:DUF6188 family protein n=1 Tax=Roseisolibacter sp. H3M3-2 TaxID=3031323 RepID=UPI0023DC6464|nr:DUF6188 family protein [Roseisolibacter sp. H3M3-2]MDF1503807.1 DUF6188 family protein [Roseisolibacter sp. H3M3-2]
MSAELDQRPDRHVLTLLDHRVTQFVVELGAVRLMTWTLHDSLELRVDVPFTLRQADGMSRRADPREPEQLAPLLTLVGRRVDALEIERDGALLAAFSDGTTVAVEPHLRQEAWRVQGAGGLEGLDYRCPAGGGTPWGG